MLPGTFSSLFTSGASTYFPSPLLSPDRSICYSNDDVVWYYDGKVGIHDIVIDAPSIETYLINNVVLGKCEFAGNLMYFGARKRLVVNLDKLTDKSLQQVRDILSTIPGLKAMFESHLSFLSSIFS